MGWHSSQWLRLFVDTRCRSAREALVLVPALGATAGAWLGAVPIPLDWDRRWQAWPLTCVYGALVGYGLGLVLACAGVLAPSQALGKSQ